MWGVVTTTTTRWGLVRVGEIGCMGCLGLLVILLGFMVLGNLNIPNAGEWYSPLYESLLVAKS